MVTGKASELAESLQPATYNLQPEKQPAGDGPGR